MCLVSLATGSSKGVRFKGFRLIFILGGVTHMGLRMLVVSQSSTKQGVTQVEEHPVTRGGGVPVRQQPFSSPGIPSPHRQISER